MTAHKAAARTLIKYPGISDGSYAGFLKATFQTPQNKSALRTLAKADFDAEYASRIRKKHPHDDKLANRYIAQATSPTALRLWNSSLSSISAGAGLTKASSIRAGLQNSQRLSNIRLAQVGRSHRDAYQKRDSWDFQSYGDFAVKTEKLNPGVEFNRSLMDDAFRLAVGKGAASTSAVPGDLERMMSRCLGRGSEDYWKGRE